MKARALIITGFGLNCEKETAKAFELLGAEVEQVHLNDLIAGDKHLIDYQILAFIGGFSFGDHLGSGTIFAYRMRSKLGDSLCQFIDAGKLIIGICNGFQVMTRLGIIPALSGDFEQDVALHHNDSGVFRDSWVNLQVNKNSPCVFTKGLNNLSLPIRHGEGKFVVKNQQILDTLEKKNLVCLRYADEQGNETSQFPLNPNGSVNNIAGICNLTGRILGLMPHPEAYLSPYNYPLWIEQKKMGVLPTEGAGLVLFRNGVRFVEENF